MTFRLKSKVIILLMATMLLLGGLAALNHHQMPMSASSNHADCNTTCKIACFSQAVGSFIALPTLTSKYLFTLPLLVVIFSALAVIVTMKTHVDAFRYSLGPPLFKQLETYRI